MDEKALMTDLPTLQAALKAFARGSGLRSALAGGGKVNGIVSRGGSTP